jgi:predicted PurR-regulated permease PerM
MQGVLVGIGYWMTGLPEPSFFGALTTVASLVPGVATVLVWLLIGVVRVLGGHSVAGLIELIYSVLLVVIAPYYVIHPKLVESWKVIVPLSCSLRSSAVYTSLWVGSLSRCR